DGATAQGAVSATDQDPGAALTYGLVGAVPAGLSMAADGTWSFDPSAAAYQHLAAGATQDIVAAWRVTDEHGASADSTLTLRVTGVNDAAIIGGADAGEAIEDGETTITGRLTIADLDDGESAFQPRVTEASYGTLFMQEDGSWTYIVDAARADMLGAGESALDEIVVRSLDGTAHTLSITIHGANDAPVAVAAEGAATEDGAMAQGAVSATDQDPGATLAYSLGRGAPAGLTMAADGTWSFDPTDAAYQHLAAGASEDVVATWRVTDEHGASADSTLTLHVTGVNDAAIIGGQDSGEAVEDAQTMIGGMLTVADVDDGEAVFQPRVAETSYGTLFMQENGAWTYMLDDVRSNGLMTGQTVTDSMVVRSLDGTEHTIAVTIHGADEIPEVWTGEGDPTDPYRNSADYPTTGLVGSNGADEIYGTPAGENISSLDGGDWVFGRGGDDVIVTGSGVDFVYAQTGADSIDGGGNDDWLYGGSGADVINAGAGDDFIYGGYGADTLSGGAGADRFAYYGHVQETGDRIVDFEVGVDKIDLTGFRVAQSQISFATRGGDTVVKVDLADGPDPEFEIILTGEVRLSYSDLYT
ncbi:MAG: VCBS domain-containing protein, partial [Methylobacteriaceae bacterium]|nr:VCBS domain-containing protein [Methylobacteriaceae bacterium]